eukprot:12884-Heterococcus_DN1.PRE.1
MSAEGVRSQPLSYESRSFHDQLGPVKGCTESTSAAQADLTIVCNKRLRAHNLTPDNRTSRGTVPVHLEYAVLYR